MRSLRILEPGRDSFLHIKLSRICDNPILWHTANLLCSKCWFSCLASNFSSVRILFARLIARKLSCFFCWPHKTQNDDWTKIVQHKKNHFVGSGSCFGSCCCCCCYGRRYLLGQSSNIATNQNQDISEIFVILTESVYNVKCTDSHRFKWWAPPAINFNLNQFDA